MEVTRAETRIYLEQEIESGSLSIGAADRIWRMCNEDGG